MTVVLLTTNLARGGAEMQVARLASGLAGKGWNVSVISLLPPTAFQEELERAGVRVFSLDMQPGGLGLKGLARLLWLLYKLRPQVLHAHMFHANLVARLIRMLAPVPVVVSTAHSIIESSRGSDDARGRERLYRLTDGLSDATVAVCRAGADRYAAIKAVSPKRLRVIPNGVDTAGFRPDGERERLRERLGIGGGFAWLAVGRLMWKKNYPAMIQGFAGAIQTPAGAGAVLLIAGAGPLEEELKRLAEPLGANVRFLGLREDVPDLMQACDGFVLSSVVEGLPMVLLEAAASGLPAVAADAGGVREAVIDGETGYVTPAGDPAALGAAMSRLMALAPGERRSLGERARQHAAARFDMENVLAQWESLYFELLHSAAVPGRPAAATGSGRAADA